jgi:hypothetical protein
MPTTPTGNQTFSIPVQHVVFAFRGNGSISHVLGRNDQELLLTRLSSLIVQSSKKVAEFEHGRPLP